MNNMKLKPYPKYKDSGIQWIGEIPEGWEVRKLKRIARIETGNTPSKNDDRYYVNGNFPWIRPDELQGFLPIKSSKFYLNEEGKLLARKIPKGSILVCCIASLGKIGIAGVDLATNQQINSVIPKENKFDSGFAKYALFASQSEYERFGNSNVVPILSKNQQGDIFYSLPPLPDQTAITNFLDKQTAKIDALIENDKKLIVLLKEKRTALINHVATKGLNPNVKLKDSGIDWIGEIPEGWEVRKISSFGFFSSSGIDKKTEPDESLVKMVNYTDIYGNDSLVIDSKRELMTVSCPRGKMISCNLKKGDIVFTPSSETEEDIGLSAVILENLKNTVFSYHVIRFRPITKINLFYKKYIGNNHFVLSQFSRTCKGTTRQILTHNDFKGILIILPPIEDQTAIANFLDKATSKIDKTIKLIEQKVNLLEEYKKSLIHYVVTGKVDVRRVET